MISSRFQVHKTSLVLGTLPFLANTMILFYCRTLCGGSPLQQAYYYGGLV